MTNAISLETAYLRANPGCEVSRHTVGGLLRRAAERAPSRTALKMRSPADSDRRTWTYGQLLGDAELVGKALLTRFRPGDHVAIWAPNVAEWWLMEFGAALAGVVLVTVIPASTERELRYILEDSGAVGLFAVGEYRGEDRAPILDRIRADLPQLREVVLLDRLGAFIAETGVRPDDPLPEIGPDDLVMIQYTSGTTGPPKGAVMRHRGVVNTSKFATERFGLDEGSVWLNCMPMSHTGGSVHSTLGTLWNLGTMIMVPQFDAGLMLRLIEEESANWITTVPTMAIRLMEHPDFSLYSMDSLRVHCCGGAPVAPELVERVETGMRCDFIMLYGQTEMSGMICQTFRGDSLEHISETVGFPLGPTEVRISAQGSQEALPVGTVGEICFRSYGVFAGYHGNEKATAEAIEPDGWFRTGDLGTMRSDGYLTITGRLKDMLIRGGENIYPREIEDVLMEHPAVVETAVFGVPDVQWGEQIVGAVRLTHPAAVSAEDLSSFLRSRIAGHKVPRSWWFVETMPATSSGKIQKFALRDEYLRTHADLDGR